MAHSLYERLYTAEPRRERADVLPIAQGIQRKKAQPVQRRQVACRAAWGAGGSGRGQRKVGCSSLAVQPQARPSNPSRLGRQRLAAASEGAHTVAAQAHPPASAADAAS